MERERAWARVQLALDERRDPLDDALLQEWFAEHPAELDRYARLDTGLCELSRGSTAGTPSFRAHPRRRLIQLAVTLAATLLAVATFHRRTLDRPEAPSTPELASQLIDYRLTATRTTGTRRFRATRELDEPLRVTHTRTETGPAATDSSIGLRMVRHTLETETNR